MQDVRSWDRELEIGKGVETLEDELGEFLTHGSSLEAEVFAQEKTLIVALVCLSSQYGV